MTNTDTLKRILDGAKAVIFDFDNVVVDSEPFHYEAYAAVFAAHGHTIDRDDYWLEWTSKGGGAAKEIRRYGLDLDPAAIQAEKDPIYAAFCRNGSVAPFPEAIETARLLRGAGFLVAIASGSYRSDIEAILEANDARDLFAAIVGKDGIARYKPDPETYIAACAELRLAPSACVAVEDAEKGVKSARAAGMKVILVETAITRGLSIGGADLSLSGVAELRDLLRRILA